MLTPCWIPCLGGGTSGTGELQPTLLLALILEHHENPDMVTPRLSASLDPIDWNQWFMRWRFLGPDCPSAFARWATRLAPVAHPTG